MIKHTEKAKQQVSDSFSKNKDPLDTYFEIKAQAKVVKEREEKDQEKRARHLSKENLTDVRKQELKKFYEERQIYERTPRKFNEIKGIGDKDKFYDFHKKTEQRIPESVQNEQRLKSREYELKALKELEMRQKLEDPAKNKINKMPLELRVILDVDPEDANKIYRLMGLNTQIFLKMYDIYRWMETHQISTERILTMHKNVTFSKEFFNIMDDDGCGGICLEELAQPLIALGLATDTGFVQKSLKALNPQKFGKGKFDAELTIKEFSRIFRTDSVSEKLINLIKEALAYQDE